MGVKVPGAQETAGPWDTGLVGGAEVEEVGAAGPASGNGLAWLQVGHEAGRGCVRQQLARRGAEALHAPHELGLYPVAHGCSGRLMQGSNGSEVAAWEGVSKQARWPRKKLLFSSILPDFSSCPPNQFPSCIVLNPSAQQPVPSLPNQISSGHPCAQNRPLCPHSTWDKARMVGGSSPPPPPGLLFVL